MLLVKQAELLALEGLGDLRLEGTDDLGILKYLDEALFAQSILHVRVTQCISELPTAADFTDDVFDHPLLDSIDRYLVQKIVDLVCNTCHAGLLHQAGTRSRPVLLIRVVIEVLAIGHIVAGDAPQIVREYLDQTIDIAP